ncbi:MAG: outer membrane protein assembly factor BamE [Gammaproteobacteria bacterium]
MRKILLLTTLIALSFTSVLTGCTTLIRPYRPPIQQGNILNQAAVNQLRVGMTSQQVETLLGRPVLKDTFNPGRWTYVYTYRPSRGAYQQKQVILYFRGNRLVRILS